MDECASKQSRQTPVAEATAEGFGAGRPLDHLYPASQSGPSRHHLCKIPTLAERRPALHAMCGGIQRKDAAGLPCMQCVAGSNGKIPQAALWHGISCLACNVWRDPTGRWSSPCPRSGRPALFSLSCRHLPWPWPWPPLPPARRASTSLSALHGPFPIRSRTHHSWRRWSSPAGT